MPSKWSSFISVVFAVVITSASSSLAATTSYTYDATNQLIRVAAEDGTAMEYYYDAVGNRLLTEHYFASIGTFRDGDWTLDTNGNGVLEPGVDRTFRFGGLAPDIPHRRRLNAERRQPLLTQPRCGSIASENRRPGDRFFSRASKTLRRSGGRFETG